LLFDEREIRDSSKKWTPRMLLEFIREDYVWIDFGTEGSRLVKVKTQTGHL